MQVGRQTTKLENDFYYSRKDWVRALVYKDPSTNEADIAAVGVRV